MLFTAVILHFLGLRRVFALAVSQKPGGWYAIAIFAAQSCVAGLNGYAYYKV